MVLEMYAKLNGPMESNTSVEVFEGHTAVVKGFPCRKDDHGMSQLCFVCSCHSSSCLDEFQLIQYLVER